MKFPESMPSNLEGTAHLQTQAVATFPLCVSLSFIIPTSVFFSEFVCFLPVFCDPTFSLIWLYISATKAM
jgi:hypothetical protein